MIDSSNEFKSDIQAVSTYLFCKDTGTGDRLTYQHGIIKGPICIDNMTKNSSVGDQFAARALALLNDKITIKLCSDGKKIQISKNYFNNFIKT